MVRAGSGGGSPAMGWWAPKRGVMGTQSWVYGLLITGLWTPNCGMSMAQPWGTESCGKRNTKSWGKNDPVIGREQPWGDAG